MKNLGPHTKFAKLSTLPALVRKQRRLEAKIAPLEPLLQEEKTVRDEIDQLLVAAGVQKGELVTCHGYDVAHHERAGQDRISAERLRGAGVAEIDIQFATTTGKASSYATVKPSKGAKVRAA